MKKLLSLLLLFNTCLFAQKIKKQHSITFDAHHHTSILYTKSNPLDSILAHTLANDIYRIIAQKPTVVTNIKLAKGNAIIIGQYSEPLLQSLSKIAINNSDLKDKWETYSYKFIPKPTPNINFALIIAGSDPRGTAFGVFDLSKKIGISPWHWWADVAVVPQKKIVLPANDYTSKPPSVQFRGIFLNDEDWGLRPWAAKTLEPEVGNIGPKTYAKIFELLLRLKANTIWPAMHEGTTAFFKNPQNSKIAQAYQIVIGSSHAEPMLRNNVDEWNKKEMGAFNYVSNQANVFKYWEDRVQETKNLDAIYTIGMRGVHDSKMEGVKDTKEAVQVLSKIIDDQRQLFQKYLNKEASKVAQAFTIYKEVLDVYEAGLKIPDDVTLVWTDDNYGYIRRLSDAQEQTRSGGAGIYYHASYWGRPHDYLWLSTTHPGLLHSEMMRAYKANCNKIWILNVGDIKPAEYITQLFLDMAFDASVFETPEAIEKHSTHFYEAKFGAKFGKSIAKIKKEYYDLAFERKPEFMGWSQTEPTTKTTATAYHSFLFGDEVTARITKYQKLENQVDVIKKLIHKVQQDAFFELVYYPVKAASLQNKKFLYADKANTYAKLGGLDAQDFKLKSEQAFDSIQEITQKYNQIANKKWLGMMDCKPRKLPVFDKPTFANPTVETNAETVAFLVEGNKTTLTLPTFYKNDKENYFVEVYLKKAINTSWSLHNMPEWLVATQNKGELNLTKSSNRIYFSINWKKWSKTKPLKGSFQINFDESVKTIFVEIEEVLPQIPKDAFLIKNEKAVIYASHYNQKKETENCKWTKQDQFGHSKALMKCEISTKESQTDSLVINKLACLEYDIYATKNTIETAELLVYALPNLPATKNGKLQIGIQWNNEPIKIVDFATIGRSEEWKQNVLANKACKKIDLKKIQLGKNSLKIFAIDTDVMLDYFYLNTNKNNPVPYSTLAETKKPK